MEAEKEESQGLKMNPDANIRKPLRARKTMTPSSRKQVELLRNLHELRRSGSSTYSVDNYVQLKMIGTECLNYKSSKETNPDLESKEMLAKEPVAKLVVNSEISIYNRTPDVSRGLPHNGCSTDTNMKQFLNAGSLQDLLLNLYEKESDSPVPKPMEVHLYPKPTSQPLDHSEEHKPTSQPSDISEEHKPTSQPSGFSEEHKPTSQPSDISEEHKPTSQPSDISEEHKPTSQPSDISEEHKPTSQPSGCSEHKPTSRPLDHSEEHKPTSQPSDHSEEHKPTSRPSDCSEKHKPTSRPSDLSEEHKPTSHPLDLSEEQKPTSRPLDHSEEHKPTSRPSDRLEEHKPTSQPSDHSEEHKPTSRPSDRSEEPKPTSQPLDRSEEDKPTSRPPDRLEEHKPTSRPLDRSEEHKPTSRPLGRSEERKLTSRPLGRSEEHKPANQPLGRSEHKPTSRYLDRSEEHKPTSRPSGRSEEQTASRVSFTSDTPTLGKTKKAHSRLVNTTTEVLRQKLCQFQFREANALSDDDLRERRTSRCKEEVSCKRITSSNETGVASTMQSDRSQSGLEKVKCLIRSHMGNLMGDLDRKLQKLNERVDHTQCLRKHEEITIRIIKKISRLDRHVNSIADLQRSQLSKQVNLQGARSKTTILNVARPVPDSPNDPSVPLKRRSEEQPGEVPSKTARSSAKEACIDVETSDVQARNSAVHNGKTSNVQARNSAVHSGKTSDVQARNSAVHDGRTSDVQARNSADAQQTKTSSDAHTSVEAPCEPKTKFLIDLTEEEDTKPEEEEVSVSVSPSPESTTSKPPQPMIELTEEIAVSFPHLPPLPKIRLHPQHMNGFRDTLPPQKLELAVAQIQNPKGIALQWNVKEVDPRCAPIESFHLFICLENKREGTRSRWIKTNEIKAMSLPMACSLSQFAAAGKCYFAMQSKDIFGRFGPFCDIQSITTG
ncbi:PREDICTED: activating transcription factor 7-interacting protein 2 [Gekko japonicus]|uniref:Activating transcription factor 7-interacting protein 2 n=1 Tax=Gekko japonicus TaxID=146911 RepID=A0ABM1JV75_GEKJA|nr:PREDICTED: activating transcription factor 7-interacting protein 2 [Gekko japonicus]